MIRVLLADHQAAVREGVRAILAAEPQISVVGEAADGDAAIAEARSLRPDVLIVDNALPGRSGLDVARALAAELPETGIVFLTVDPGLRDLALAAGATAFVAKDAPSEDLVRAVRATASALRTRRRLSGVTAEWRRVIEILLAGHTVTEDDVDLALRHCGRGESLASAFIRLELVQQSDLAEALARASTTPLVSIAPYPEIGAPIAPTEARLSSPRLVDPIDHFAARLLPLDLSRGLGLVVTAASGGEGVVAMADPLDDNAHAEAERRTKLRLSRVAAPIDEIQDALLRAWANTGPGAVISTGDLRGKVRTILGLVAVVLASLTIFGLVFRDALAPRFAFSLFALFCGVFFFVYALKYYVTLAAVLVLALFGDSLTRFRHRVTQRTAPAADAYKSDGRKASGERTEREPRGQHHEGYQTLRGEKLDSVGTVMVDAPWPRIGAHRLPVDRQPFVSVQVALYNERHVVDRLLAACTSFDYENYEVIVADDSTDETVERLERWKDNPRVKVLHRSSRQGFKGGALQEALRRMNPRTEYVMVFDADFIPPADAIWHFLDYFGRLAANGHGHGNGNGQHANGNGHGNGNGHVKVASGAPQNGDRLAVVQGYQWHMLNASENWITKGVRAEFAGSYVLERAGQELFGAMKMISGSVYMIRADVLRKLGWSTSITEDWELTIRLYLAGYKVLYTPYIQAPAECVSTIRRLIKQRMRWAEGHTYNVKKYFLRVLRSPNLTWQEKLEFVYYAPYYLQSVLFSIGTLAWILGVFVMGAKLPMWGEAFGWSLVVSNALALPLLNLAGVLLEGSLRRDAAGLLSFIGLSWILVPFQAYASLKGLFEREEGGWVRTPKSGRVTEALAEFRIAKLFPWELPGRSRTRRRSRLADVALTCVGVAIAVMVLGVGALSAKAAGATGTAEVSDLVVPVVATVVPLSLLAIGWLRVRRKVAVACIALSAAIAVNVVFLAGTIPAAGVTDNSSVFTFRNTSSFGALDMVQNYTPPTGTPATVPAGYASNWSASFTSDTFTTGQTMSAGTAQADLYVENAPSPIAFRGAATVVSGTSGSNSLTVNVPAGVQNGDFMIAAVSIRDTGSGAAMGTPAPGWTALRPMMNGTWSHLYMYTRVANAEPASYTWSFTAKTRSEAAILAYSGVDAASPVIVDDFATQPGFTDTYVTPSITTTVANAMIVTTFSIGGATPGLSINPPAGMTERYDIVIGNTSVGTQEAADAIQASAGPSGQKTATASASGNQAAGVAHIMALRPAVGTPSCTVTATVKKTTPIALRSSTTKTLVGGTSLIMDTPASVQTNDLMLVVIGWNASTTTISTVPSGWTLASGATLNQQALFIYRRFATASEPATYTWTFTAAATVGAWEAAYVGVDTTTPVDANQSTFGSGTTHTTPSTTASQANDLVMAAYSLNAVSTFSTPPAMTSEAVVTGGSGPGVSLAVFDMIQSNPGTITAKTTTTSASAGDTNTIIAFRPIASNTVTLGSATTVLGSIASPTLRSVSISTSAATFATGDRLVFELSVPNDGANCGVRLSYDEAGTPSKLTVATIVPEGVAGLILLAPALPFVWRWRRRWLP